MSSTRIKENQRIVLENRVFIVLDMHISRKWYLKMEIYSTELPKPSHLVLPNSKKPVPKP